MGRTEAKSGQAAKRPMAATSGASSPRDVSVLSIVADLEGRDLDGLRRQWRAHLGGEAPAHLPRWLLMRVLAYRLQSDAFGDLDKSIRRNLRSEKDDGACRMVISTTMVATYTLRPRKRSDGGVARERQPSTAQQK